MLAANENKKFVHNRGKLVYNSIRVCYLQISAILLIRPGIYQFDLAMLCPGSSPITNLIFRELALCLLKNYQNFSEEIRCC